jgi:hypothetical protein
LKKYNMTAQEHYDKHLGGFYSWMVDNFEEKQKEQQQFLEKEHIKPASTKLAIDLDKVRISTSPIKNILINCGMIIVFDGIVSRLNTIIATKG